MSSNNQPRRPVLCGFYEVEKALGFFDAEDERLNLIGKAGGKVTAAPKFVKGKVGVQLAAGHKAAPKMSPHKTALTNTQNAGQKAIDAGNHGKKVAKSVTHASVVPLVKVKGIYGQIVIGIDP